MLSRRRRTREFYLNVLGERFDGLGVVGLSDELLDVGAELGTEPGFGDAG